MPSAVREGSTPPPRRLRPQVWLVPVRRSDWFVGRESILNGIREGLVAESRVTITEADLSLKGLGKSQVALEYVHRFAESYRFVLWANAEDEAVLAAEYVGIASALNLPECSSGDQRVQIEAVRRWLSGNSGWILVLDDIPESLDLDRFVPPDAGGHVVVNAAASQQVVHGARLVLEPFSADESKAFLGKRSRQVDAVQARQLANRLGNLPLALELAGAYADETAVSLLELDKLVEQRLMTTSEERTRVEPKRVVTALLGVVLERIGGEHPVVLDLLALGAFLGSTDLFLALLRDGAAHLLPRLCKAVADESTFEEAVGVLIRYGLGARIGESLSFHPFLQSITREALNREQREAWAGAALRLVASAFPVESHYDHILPACSRLLPHVFAATRHAESLGIVREETGALLNQTGLYLRGCGEFKSARNCYRRAVALARMVYGEKHQTVATRINNLGVVQQETGAYEEARACYEEAAAICEAVHGSPHETTTKPLRNLCHLFEIMKDHDAARETYRRIISIYIELGGWNHPTVPECFNSLGIMFHNQRRFYNARECFDRAIAAEENAKAPRKENLIHYCNNLGTVFLDEGRPRKAQKQFERAFELERELYGECHEAIALTLTSLGHAHRAQKRFADARKCLEEALRIHEMEGRRSDPHVARALAQLGKTLRSLGEPAQARECFERLLAIHEAGHPSDAPVIAKDLIDLARVLEDLGLYADSQRCYERALAIEEENLGSKHEHVATILTFVGRVLQRQGKPRDALARLQRALAIDTAATGKSSPPVARDALHIGSILSDLGDHAGALGHLMRAQEIYESSLGREHVKTREVRDKLDALAHQAQ